MTSILVISLSCVGDAIMTTPVLEALHHRYPEAVIDIVSDRRSDIIYRHCPYRRHIFLKHKKTFLRGAPALLRELREHHYDLIVDLRTDGLAYLCHAHRRLTRWGRKPYGKHAVQELMGVIASLHGNAPIPPATVWLTSEEHDKAGRELSTLPAGKWLAMVPGNANPAKVWPAERYAALANRLESHISGVILDGGPGEERFTREVAALLRLPCVDLAGTTSLLESAAVLARAALFVGADSGPGHIAAAMGTTTITLFSVDTPERVLPWGPDSHALTSPDRDIASISVEQVQACALSILQQREKETNLARPE